VARVSEGGTDRYGKLKLTTQPINAALTWTASNKLAQAGIVQKQPVCSSDVSIHVCMPCGICLHVTNVKITKLFGHLRRVKPH